MIHIAGDVTQSIITNIRQKDIQPNAIDLSVQKIFSMYGDFILDEKTKKQRQKQEVDINEQGYYHLKEHRSYEVLFSGKVTIADNEAGIIVPRSTLNRNGVFITTGLYDSGYGKNAPASLGACIHIRGGDAFIKPGTRIAQFVLFNAEMIYSYTGSYGKGNVSDLHLCI